MQTENIEIISTGDDYRLSYSYNGADSTIEIEGIGDSLPDALRQLAEEIEWAHNNTGPLAGGINPLGGGQ